MTRSSKLLVAFTAMALVLAACGGDGEGGDDGSTTTAGGGETTTCEVDQVDGDLSFYNWTEYIDPDLVTAFEEQYGIDVIEDFYDSNEAMLAKLQAGSVYDLIVPSDYMVGIMIEEGLLAEVQKDAVPNISNLASRFADPAYDPGGVYSVAYQWGTTGLGVDLEVVGEDFEPSWALIFDPDLVSEYPGGITLLNDPRETLGAALKYNGFSLNSTSTDELQQAVDTITAVKDYIVAFDSDLFTDNLVNGEAAITHGFSGGYFATFDDIDGWDSYAYIIPEEGATLWVDNMVVPTVSAHPCSAHTFMNYLLDAENGAALTNWNFYASPNEASEEFILPEILEDDTIYPSEEVSEKLEIIESTGDFEINYTDYFAQARG